MAVGMIGGQRLCERTLELCAFVLIVILDIARAGWAQALDVDWASAQLVTVQLVDDRFVPEKLVFRRGVPYHLHLENNGADVHEFTAPEFFKTVTIKNPEVLEQGRHEVFLQPKERKDLYFVALTPGHYSLTCANHDWDGMVGDITVE